QSAICNLQSARPQHRAPPCAARGASSTSRGRNREILLEMLVRGAVLAARQWSSLARRALARARVTRQRTAVKRDALLHVPIHVFPCQCHVALDRPIDVQLTRHREVHPYVPEK